MKDMHTNPDKQRLTRAQIRKRLASMPLSPTHIRQMLLVISTLNKDLL